MDTLAVPPVEKSSSPSSSSIVARAKSALKVKSSPSSAGAEVRRAPHNASPASSASSSSTAPINSARTATAKKSVSSRSSTASSGQSARSVAAVSAGALKSKGEKVSASKEHQQPQQEEQQQRRWRQQEQKSESLGHAGKSSRTAEAEAANKKSVAGSVSGGARGNEDKKRIGGEKGENNEEGAAAAAEAKEGEGADDAARHHSGSEERAEDEVRAARNSSGQFVAMGGKNSTEKAAARAEAAARRPDSDGLRAAGGRKPAAVKEAAAAAGDEKKNAVNNASSIRAAAGGGKGGGAASGALRALKQSADNLSTTVKVTATVGSSANSEESASIPARNDEEDDEADVSPNVSDIDADEERDTCDPELSPIPVLQQQKINKRSESDGIVVVERPKPDKPVRRCESSDDMPPAANASAKADLLQQHGNKFPQNIKTVASATIVRGPEDATHLIGQSVHMCAHYFGNPEPRVTWLRNGARVFPCDDGVPEGQRRVLIKTYSGESTLIVRDLRLDDSGKYEVLIENEIGNDAAAASLGVEGPPEPPAGRPYASDMTDNSSLTLAWYGSTFDGGSIVTGYVVEMSSWPITSDSAQPEATDWTVLTAECHSTSYIVTGLDSSREYIFRVKAANVHGASEPSSVSEPVSFGNSSSAASGEDEASAPSEKSGEGDAGDDDEGAEDGEGDESFEAPFQHRIVSLEPGSTFKDKYEIYEELGRGRFGVVFKVKDRGSGEQYAAKFIRCRKQEDKQKCRDEITIMNSLEHPRLLQLAAAYENQREIIMTMEYIGGGELFEKVVADDFKLTERDCMLFMRQIASAIGFMHAKDIVHLDLKPENILCKSKRSHQIKIIDFGLARKVLPGEDVRILFGTPEFVSPEVINYEPVTPTSDMWSVGVVCYVLLSGLSPFMGENDVETFANITGISYDFEDDAFDPISETAKDFICKLLVKNQRKRLTAAACLEHEWLAQAERTSKCSYKELNTDKLKSFLMRRRWQKAAHAIRALGRFTSLGFRGDGKDGASSITAVSTQSADF